jgi:hypothetical protein
MQDIRWRAFSKAANFSTTSPALIFGSEQGFFYARAESGSLLPGLPTFLDVEERRGLSWKKSLDTSLSAIRSTCRIAEVKK